MGTVFFLSQLLPADPTVITNIYALGALENGSRLYRTDNLVDLFSFNILRLRITLIGDKYDGPFVRKPPLSIE